MLGGLIGMGIGSMIGTMQGSQQRDDQKYLMQEQAKLNKQQANYTNELQKQYWDYTNYENQVKHLKEAGLNPALLYGNGGQGGQTGGGQAAGVGLPQANSVAIAQQAMQMGLQLEGLRSQVKLNDSQTEKNQAEANKIAGVDTKLQEATIDNLIKQTSNEEAKNGLIYSQKRVQDALTELTDAKTNEIGWNIKSIEKDLERMSKAIEGLDLDNQLKNRTIDAQVAEATERVRNVMADTIVKYSQAKVNNEEAQAIGEKVMQGWGQLKINEATKEQGWINLEQQAEKIMNDLNLGKMGIDVEKQKIVKDYVLGIGNMIVNIAKEAGTFVKGATKIGGFK